MLTDHECSTMVGRSMLFSLAHVEGVHAAGWETTDAEDTFRGSGPRSGTLLRSKGKKEGDEKGGLRGRQTCTHSLFA